MRVPDTVLDGSDLAGLRVRAASVRGERHRAQSRPRQDAFGLWEREGWLLACVADCVGSQPRSHLGAQEACRLLGELPCGEHLIDEINDRLVSFAEDRAIAPVHVSTTLTAALVERDTGRCVLLCVGDSPVWLVRGGQWQPLLGHRQPGTATDALPSPAPRFTRTEVLLEPGDLLLLCTDGLGDVLREPGRRHWLAERWRQVPGWAEFCAHMHLANAEHDDDRSAVCVWIDPGTLQADGSTTSP